MTSLKEIFASLREIAKRLHTHRWQLIPPLAGLMSIYLLLQSDKAALLFTALVGVSGATSVLKIQPQRLIRFYFLYLMFEGALKILSNYNPLIHVGSDLLLIVIFLRLVPRFSLESVNTLAPEVRKRLDRVSTFLLMFWLWVGVQFFNPWGLGFLPSVAGLKIHVIPMLMLFVAGYLLTDEELKSLPPLLLGMGLFQGAVALIDWWLGPQVLPLLHPRYQTVLLQFLQGFPYRPFGTTNLPGAPAMWMFHTLTGSLILFHLVSKRDVTILRPKIWSRLFVVFLPLALGTLLVCQVRASIVRFLAMIFAGTFVLGRKYVPAAVLAIAAVPLAMSFAPKKRYEELVTTKDSGQAMRLQQALARLNTIGDSRSWQRAGGGSWAINELIERASFTMAGNGLSRFGAAAAPWKALMDRDRHFKPRWSFSDNVFLALFTELGLGGLLAYLLLVSSVVWHLFDARTKLAWLCAGACGITVLSGLGSEGILFQPDASFFWMYAALGLRSPGITEGGAAA